MILALRSARAFSAGDARLGVLVAAGAVALLVGALKFWNLGDLSLMRKFVESLAWVLTVFVGGALVGFLLVSGIGDAARAVARPDAAALRSVSVEELSSIESELPEMTPSELDGMKGETPEELASVLKKIAEGG